MKILPTASDAAILQEIGERLAAERVLRELTQADLAREAGVSKRTVERLENGESVQLANLVRVLRAVGLLEKLDALLPPAAPGPMDLLAGRRRPRQRVRRKFSSIREPKQPWRWGEDR